MPQMQNRVQETTTTGGTGTLTLSGAVTGYITFASGFSTGASLFYTVDNGVGEWEIGIGTLVTTGTLSRVTVIASSNGGALVNFGSGTKRVFCSAPTRSLVPDQDSNSGKVLTTDGTNPAWTTTLNGITIGNLTAAAGAFTTLSASSTVSGTGFSTYLASPPAIGGTAAAAGAFTTLSSSSTTTVGTNLVFSGTGNRITGDFSNATIANRVAFQTSTVNGATDLIALPNGTGTRAGFLAYNNSDVAAATANTQLLQLSTETRLIAGGSSPLPMTFYIGGSERVRIDTSGNLGLGVTPSAIGSGFRAVQIGPGAGVTIMGGGGGAESGANNFYDGSNYRYVATAPATLYAFSAGQHRWFTAPSGTAGNTISFTQAMTLTAAGVLQVGSAISLDPTTANALVVNSSGNVGMGTNSPAANNRLTLSDTNSSKLTITGGSVQNGMLLNAVSTASQYYIGSGNNLLVGGDKGFLIYDATNARGKFYVEDVYGETRTIATTFLSYYTGTTERARITAAGDVLVTGGGGLGYGTGSGGTVTQGAGSGKATAVTLNKTTGQITMNNAALAAGAEVLFQLLNSTIGANDTVHVNSSFSTSGNYTAYVSGMGSGYAYIVLKNRSGGSLSEAVLINFAVIKGATS